MKTEQSSIKNERPKEKAGRSIRDSVVDLCRGVSFLYSFTPLLHLHLCSLAPSLLSSPPSPPLRSALVDGVVLSRSLSFCLCGGQDEKCVSESVCVSECEAWMVRDS